MLLEWVFINSGLPQKVCENSPLFLFRISISSVASSVHVAYAGRYVILLRRLARHPHPSTRLHTPVMPLPYDVQFPWQV